MMKQEILDKIASIPRKDAPYTLRDGCIVLEGGAFRGLYTQGALDFYMEKGINFQTTIGVSAGAMAGMNYVSGQIGRSAIINLSYRSNHEYVGVGAMRRDHGITGFSYLWNEISETYPLNEERFNDPSRRFVAVATNIDTGKAEYFEKGKTEDMLRAVQASATVPYVSEAVAINDSYYLDGGIADRIPFGWALEEGFEKIVVIRTRDEMYRKPIGRPLSLNRIEYRKYPSLIATLMETNARYNMEIEQLNWLEKEGRIFVLKPSRPIAIHRFESNLDALYDLWELGYHDAEENYEELLSYLNKESR